MRPLPTFPKGIFAEISMMQLTYFGHSCFSVVLNGKTLLFDPFISYNPLAKHIDIKSIKADFILLSHGHADHVADVGALAAQTGALVIGSHEVTEWFKKNGVENVHGMNPGGKTAFPFGTLRGVAAVHSSSMPDGSYGGNPMGLVIESNDGCLYYSGDTALTMDMKLLPHISAPIDVAVLPIGGNYTMDAADAALAAEWIQCKSAIGVHYNTFPPIAIDTTAAKAVFNAKKVPLWLPAIGETITI